MPTKAKPKPAAARKPVAAKTILSKDIKRMPPPGKQPVAKDEQITGHTSQPTP